MAERNMPMKNSGNTIRNQIRDLPAGSAVPEPTAVPRAPSMLVLYIKLHGILATDFESITEISYKWRAG